MADPSSPAASPLRELLSGLRLPADGAVLLLRGAGLLPLALLPALLTLAVTVVVAGLTLRHGSGFAELLWARPVGCEDCGPGAWLWTRVAVASWLVFRAAAGLLLVSLAALLCARVLAAPLMDLLARRALRLLGARPAPGVVAEGDLPLHRGLAASMGGALARTAILLAGLAVLWVVAWIPAAAVIVAPAGLVWAGAWLFADTVVYPLQWVGSTRLGSVLGLVAARPFLCAGFAVSTALVAAIPLAGLLTTPVVVAGASLLVARAQPAAEVEPAAAEAPAA